MIEKKLNHKVTDDSRTCGIETIERLIKIDWEKYHNDRPFNPSALAMYKWAPIADELKTLDRKIVLNSVILKWDVIKKEFKDRIRF